MLSPHIRTPGISRGEVKNLALSVAAGICFGFAGSSITSNSSSTTFNGNLFCGGANAASLQAEVAFRINTRGYVGCMASVGGSYISNVNDGGANGFALLEYQVPKLIANKCQVAYICSGTNECGNSSVLTSGQLDTYMEQYTRAITTLRNGGCEPVIWNLPPRGSGANQITNTAAFNARLVRLCASLGVRLIDLFGMCYDGSTAVFISGYNASDGVHIDTAAGMAAVGSALAAACIAPFPAGAFNPSAIGSVLGVGNFASIGATGPTGFTTLTYSDGGYVHAARDPSGFDTATQLYPGTGWRTTGTAKDRACRGVNGVTGFTAGERWLLFAKVRVDTNSGAVNTNPCPCIRLQQTNAGASNLGRIDLMRPYLGTTFSDSLLAIAFWVNTGADRVNLLVGTELSSGGAGTANTDFTIGGLGLVRIA